MFLKPQQLHFTGIGGIGMSGIAEILLNLGYQITGSDVKLTPITERLQSLGAKVYEGHAAENIDGAKALVVTSAVDAQNPELVEARRLGIPVIPRGELLAELMRLKYGIAVAGSHGKTTTTSMAATILSHAGLDPTVVVGGRVATMGGSNARLGKSSFLVVESDESDGSFLKLSPILAIVTNIDREHLDHYSDIDEIRDAFTDFVNKVPFYGAAILCLDDDNVQQILPNVNRRIITYGMGAQAMLVSRTLRVDTCRARSIFVSGIRISANFISACQASTTCETRPPRSRLVWSWRFRPTSSARGLRSLPESTGDSSSAGRKGASRSSTITATIRRRFEPRSPPPAIAGSAVYTRFSSPIAIHERCI